MYFKIFFGIYTEPSFCLKGNFLQFHRVIYGQENQKK